MAASEVAHRRLVCEGNDGSFGAGFEHRLDVLRSSPRDHAQFRMLLFDAAHMLGVGDLEPLRRNCVTL
jgi:hypothetical protein